MKRIAVYLLLVLIGLSTVGVNLAKATTYVDTLGANYNPTARSVFRELWDGSNSVTVCQSFTATGTTLTNYFDILAYGNADASAYRLTMYGNFVGPMYDLPGSIYAGPGDSFYRASTMGALNGSPNNLAFTRFTNESGNTISVTESEKYWICLWPDAETGAGKVMSWYGDITGAYSGGNAASYPSGAPYDSNDLGFKSYYKIAEVVVPTLDPTPDPTPDPAPVATPTPTTTTPTPTTTTPTVATPAAAAPLPAGVTAGNAAAPATPTASIKAPTAVTIADVAADQGGLLVLGWKASTTTDIDGYKIFRSTEEKLNFKEVALTVKAILTYTDNAATIGQKYYYIVRAYKGALESASSSTVNGLSVDNLAPIVPTNFTFTKNALDFTFAWDKNAEADVSGYTLLVLDPADSTKVLETIEISKDLNSYELLIGDHAALTTGIAYKFSLLAKDISGNLSEKVVATEKAVEVATGGEPEVAKEVVVTSNTDKNNSTLYIISGIVALLLLGGGLYWFKFRKKVKA